MDDDAGRGPPVERVRMVAGTKVRLRHFSRSLPMSLLQAREAVMQHFRPALRHFGITEQQWRILRALSSVETIEIMALADVTFLLPPSLSRILKGLEERGLILRRTSDEDMRCGLVSISAKGQDLIDRAGVYSEQIYAEITRRFGAERLVALQAMLRELEAVVSDGAPITDGLEFEDEPVEIGSAHRRGRPRKLAV